MYVRPLLEADPPIIPRDKVDAFVRKDSRDPSKEKRVFINKKLASRARGWAVRIREMERQRAARAIMKAERAHCSGVDDNAADAEFHQYLYETGQIDPYEF